MAKGKEKLDIVEVVESYDIKLSDDGGGRLKSLCPFHREDTPSFKVWPDKGTFYCFGCNFGGDVIGFVKNMEGVGHKTALQILNTKYGFDTGETKPWRSLRILYQANEYATRIFSHFLQASKAARDYVRERGFKEETIKKFRIGYSPADGEKVIAQLRKEGFGEDTLLRASLLSREKSKSFPYFSDRIIFPLFDTYGRIAGFSGRTMKENDAKYINSRTTEIFDKSNFLYSLNFARQKLREGREAIVGEGYTDAISAHQAGIDNFVSICGAFFTGEQSQIIARYTDKVIIATDADEPGINAIRKSYNRLKHLGLEVKVAVLPKPYKDPDEVIQKLGGNAFKDCLAEPEDFFDFSLNLALSQHDKETRDGRISIARTMIPLVASSENYIEKAELAKTLCERCNFDEGALYEALKDKKIQEREIVKLPETLAHERVLLTAIINASASFLGDKKEIERKVNTEFFNYPVNRRIYRSYLEGSTEGLRKEEERVLVYMLKAKKVEREAVEEALQKLQEAKKIRKRKNLEEEIIIADKEGNSEKLLSLLKNL